MLFFYLSFWVVFIYFYYLRGHLTVLQAIFMRKYVNSEKPSSITAAVHTIFGLVF